MCDSKELRMREARQALLPGVLAPPAPSQERAARRTRLSPKQKLFVEAYLQTLNATEAARRSGYSDANASCLRILHNPLVWSAIEARMAERRAQNPHLEQRILEELCRIAFADPRELMRWGPDGVELRPSEVLSPEAAAQVSEVAEGRGGVIRLKKHDKLKALELLGRHLGMFADRLHAEVSGPGGAPLREDKRILVQFVAGEGGGRMGEIAGEGGNRLEGAGETF
jgi:phage terminase small subunit